METLGSHRPAGRLSQEEAEPANRHSFLYALLSTGRTGFIASVFILLIAATSHNPSFVVAGCVALLYTTLLCSMMLLEKRRIVMKTTLRHSVTAISDPNVITYLVSGHGQNSPLLLAVEPRFPSYVVPRHRKSDGASVVFFDATRKGQYAMGAARILIQDPLRIFHTERTFDASLTLTVVPRPIPLSTLHIALTSPIDGQRIRYAPNVDTSQLTGTHPYDGESMNRIHWKASAHTGTLVVKDFTPSASQTVILMVDYSVSHDTVFPLETLDNTLSTAAASMLRYVHDHKLPFGLVTLGSAVEWTDTGRDSMHLYRCLAGIARAAPTRGEESEPISNWLVRNTRAIPAQSQLIVLAHEASESEIVHLLKLRDRFSRIVLILFPAGSFLMPGEHRAPCYFRDTSELLHLRSLQHRLKENRIELVVVGLNDPLTGQ